MHVNQDLQVPEVVPILMRLMHLVNRKLGIFYTWSAHPRLGSAREMDHFGKYMVWNAPSSTSVIV